MTSENYNELVKVIQSAVPEIIVNKNAQLIKFDHSVEYFEQKRPITLEDCLIALGKDLLEKYLEFRYSANYMVIRDIRLNNIGGNDRCIWVCNKFLDEQSDETKQFLFDILINK